MKLNDVVLRHGVAPREFTLDVRSDKYGERFLIRLRNRSQTELVVFDVQRRDRHLLLLSRNGQERHRFLLGYDVRHWLVAGI